MSEGFNVTTIDQLAKQLKEPTWLTELRRQAWAKHGQLPWPHPSDDIWRRTDVSLLDPAQGFSPTPPSLLQAIPLAGGGPPLARLRRAISPARGGVPLSDAQLAELTRPLGHEQLFVRANGAWVSRAPVQGIVVDDLTQAASRQPDPIRQVIEADGFSEAEQKLSTLNTAFHHDDLVVQVPPSFTTAAPIRLVHLLSAAPKQAIFPMTVITVGAGSSITLIDEYVSLPTGHTTDAHLVNSRIELVLEPDASVHYVRLQRWDLKAREFLLQRATLARGATLTMANITLGAAISKAHIVTKLNGEHASTKLYGFVFGHHAQHVDQHTLQDHRAAHTTSDLQFRAALQDASRMIYTGLIRIAKQATQTNAYQANHNLMLSQEAKAETIPMLEILADDVQCKHGASIGPIDEEQTFYLTSRGVPREIAQRLIVMGFIEPIMQQVPFEPLQQRLREEIEGVLHHG